MTDQHLWNCAKALNIQTGPEIVGNFSLGFDDRIPEETKEELIRFVYWVEDHFSLPVTLWVDFKYNHYLMDKQGRRTGYRFYWAEFATFPVMDREEDIPVIELPVRTEYQTVEKILESFVRAICLYFVWLGGDDPEGYVPSREEVQEVLAAYAAQRA